MKKVLIRLLIPVVILIAVFVALYFVNKKYTVKNVYVDGNKHYTKEEIESMVLDKNGYANSLILSLKYKNKQVTDIPFIDYLSVEVLSPDSIKIIVYEKTFAGIIEFMDTYMYFDKDGTVIECANELTKGIPIIYGLKFTHLALGESIEVEDPKIFETILDFTKLLNKYGLEADKIIFNSSNTKIIFGDITVSLGKDLTGIEDRFMVMPQFLEKLEGMSGTLNMEKSNATNGSYSFRPE